MNVDTKISGWNFGRVSPITEAYYSANGASTLDDLRKSLEKLENRLVELPAVLKNYQDAISRMQSDINYLAGLSNRKKKKWSKENGGKDVGQVIYDLEKKIDVYEGKIDSAKAEQKRLPSRISDLKNQIKALVEAEGKGIEKGLDPEAAKQLGEIEVAKQQQELEFQKQQQQAQQKQAEQQQQEKEEADKKASQTQWFIIAGVGLLLIIGIIVAIKKFRANQLKVAAS
ncbi:type VII secretion EssA family protein [Parvicella tangerina]|uniref:Uncharacterized protein n=1 Tax=Parvicella tangerina TaxID=2829795 RepID=A0A916NDI8_9FLAO|nr:type VII secretion EssA family protein [Parvicella tangerina]CAG5086786.1 hypothetical protein CRYO30217_03278 [Parvicella tangerina]